MIICWFVPSPPRTWELVMTLAAVDDLAYVYIGDCRVAALHRVTENPRLIYSGLPSALPGRRLDLGRVSATTVITIRLENDLKTYEIRGDVIEPRSERHVIDIAPMLSGQELGSVYIASYYGDGRPAPISPRCATIVSQEILARSRAAQAASHRAAFRPPAARDGRFLAGALVAALGLLTLLVGPPAKTALRRGRSDRVMNTKLRRQMICRTVTIFDGGEPVATGFLLSSPAGPVVHIATCLHVLEDVDGRSITPFVSVHPLMADRLGVQPDLPLEAKRLARDPERDLAILALPVEKRGVESFSFSGPAERLESEAKVFSTPLHGETQRSWRDGWLAETNVRPQRIRDISGRASREFEHLTTDVLVLNLAALRGASGAPVCDVTGRLIAMVVAVSDRGNTTYAVPASALAGWEQRAEVVAPTG